MLLQSLARRTVRTLVLGELDAATGLPVKSTLQAVTAARSLTAAGIGSGRVDFLPVATGSVERVTAALARLVTREKYSHVVAASTSLFKDCIPRLGGLLGVQPVTEVLAILDTHTFKRPIYAGNAIQTVRTGSAATAATGLQLLTVRATAFSAAQALPETRAVLEPETQETAASEVVELRSQDSEAAAFPPLSTASRVVAGGRGLKSKENFEKLVLPLAKKLKAAVGASRAAVDAGYVSNELQVGQTGKIVAPEIYFAVGISGAIQHVAGMKDSRVIVAINADAEAAIFQVADYGLAGDLFQILPELTQKL